MKMGHLFAIGIFLFIIFAGCTQFTKEKNVEYETYSNEYFSIKYPENWDVKTEEEGYIDFLSKFESSKDMFEDGVAIAIVDINEVAEEYSTLDNINEASKDGQLELYENEEVISKGKKELNGYETFEIVSEWYDQDLEMELKRKTVYLIEEGKEFMIICIFEKGKEDKYELIIEEMINSFNILYKQPEESVTYEEYNNDYFSIKYPKNWDVEIDEQQVNIKAKLEGSTDKYRDKIVITVWDTSEEYSDLEDMEKHEDSILYENEKVISRVKKELNGYSILETNNEWYAQNSKLYLKRKAVYIIEKGKIFTIECIYEKDKEEIYGENFEKMLESFEVIYTKEQGEDTGIAYKTYTNEYFSMDYPDEWNIEQGSEVLYENESMEYVILKSRLENGYDNIYELAVVKIASVSEEFDSIEELKAIEESLLYEGEELISSQEIGFKGLDAFEFSKRIKTIDGLEIPHINTEIQFIHTDKIYIVGYIFEEGKEDKYQPIFEEMLDSFEITYSEQETTEEMVG